MSGITRLVQLRLWILVAVFLADGAATDSFVVDARSVDRARQSDAKLRIPVSAVQCQ
jgi:hypothetical protein